MHARLVLFDLGPGQRDFAEGLADQFAPIYESHNGFKGTTFLADFETGECGALSVWATEADAEAAGAALMPQLKDAVGDRLKGPPTVKVLEVYEPKT